MKKFEEYVQEGVVRRIFADVNRSKNIYSEALRKYQSLQYNISKLGVSDDNANDFIEHCYDCIMFLIRSKLFKEGFKCIGLGAHEAEVSFSLNIGFSESDMRFLDELRYFRNGILYYGKRFDVEYAQKVTEFTHKIFERENI